MTVTGHCLGCDVVYPDEQLRLALSQLRVFATPMRVLANPGSFLPKYTTIYKVGVGFLKQGMMDGAAFNPIGKLELLAIQKLLGPNALAVEGGAEGTGAMLAALAELAIPVAGEEMVAAKTINGTATIFKDGGHASILVKMGDESLHTHQVIIDEIENTTIEVYKGAAGADGSVTIALPDARAAMNFQRSILGKDTGRYDQPLNSCLTHCGDVLRAGGVDAPEGTFPLYRWLLRLERK